MIYDNRELKKRARQKLVGRYGITAGTLLLCNLITTALFELIQSVIPGNLYSLSQASSMFSIAAYLVCSIIIVFLGNILRSGYRYLHMNIARQQPCSVSNLFYGFNHQPDKVILLILRVLSINLLYMLPCLFISYVVGSLFYTLLGTSIEIFSITAIIVAAIVLIPVNLRYVLIFNLWADYPDLTVKEMTLKSREMMRGNRTRYFLLILSFIGWYLLALLSLGIGLIWIQPYVMMTCTQFYLELNESQRDTAYWSNERYNG